MNARRATTTSGLLIMTALVVTGTIGLRWWWPVASQLDTRQQTRAPKKDLPGAGTIPVQEFITANGRVMYHCGGTSTIPEKPQRIVTLGWTDEVLALGITPVAALADAKHGFPDYLADRLVTTTPIDGSAGAPDLEAIAAAQPDLIIATWFWNDSWATLERIAPTILLQPAHWEWRERVRDIGTVLNRRDEADAVLSEFDQHLLEARAKIRAGIGEHSVALLRIHAREFRLYGFGYSGPLLYGDLALTKPQIVSDVVWSRDMTRLSLEGLARLDADILLLMTEESLPVSYQVEERLAHHPLWLALPAVRAGKIVAVPNILMRGGVIARRAMVDLLVKELGP